MKKMIVLLSITFSLGLMSLSCQAMMSGEAYQQKLNLLYKDITISRLDASFAEAVEQGDSARVDVLLKLGANPNVRGFLDITPIFYAANQGNIPMVEKLLAAGADINARESRSSMTPLAVVEREGYKNKEQMIKLLKSRGARS